MRDSPPTKKRTVKVLFFGQSITQEIWSVWLSDYLRQKYPNANLIITNRAIGYNAEVLVRPADTEVYPFYPDLMIYHNYGSMADLERIVARTRARTTADILLQNDHPIYPEDLTESTDLTATNLMSSDAYRAYVFLPEIARRYGAEVADIRSVWKNYLITNNLAPSAELRDERHPNLQGNYLMEDLFEPHFRADDSFSDQDWRDSVKTFAIGSDVDWTNNTLTFPFVGNRADLIYSGNGASPVEVTIDGKAPGSFPDVCSFTRTQYYPGTYWLCVLRISSRTPLIPEEWKATVLSYSSNGGNPFIRFAVKGSVTGDDGEGVSNQLFVSNSGRVVIEPGDWLMLSWAYAYFPALSPLPVGYEIKWSSIGAFNNEVTPRVTDPSIEATETVVQGISNGPHVLTLRRTGATPISGIRIYNPLARPHPNLAPSPSITNLLVGQDKVTVNVNATARYVLESSSDLNPQDWEGVSAPITDTTVQLPITSTTRFFRLRRND